MYALDTPRPTVRRWNLQESLAWRARWALLAVAAVALLGAGYAREAATSPLLGGGAGATETVTVEAGDTLWGIAASRYPDADVREKVFQIEQVNGMSGPTIQAGQKLRVPVR
jgi:nucleoid-associated protein YgaU